MTVLILENKCLRYTSVGFETGYSGVIAHPLLPLTISFAFHNRKSAMAKFAVILPAAGRSTRFLNEQRKKPFVNLKGRAVWLRSAEHFVNRDDVAQTIVVVADEDLTWFKEKFAPNLAFMNIDIVTGGANRAESVKNGLNAVNPDIEYVAVHDAARPLLIQPWVDRVFQEAQKTGAAILGVPVAGTLKRVEGDKITQTVSRESLWEAQTPQVFRREWLEQAYAQQGDLQPTDEAQLIEHFGKSVSIVSGSTMNFKITTPDDMRLAEVTLDALPKPKGLRALHPFSDEEPRLL